MLKVLALAAFAYLLGSVPSGWLVMKVYRNQALRKLGSGNIGAANVFRAGGPGAFTATLVADGLKGFIPVMLGIAFGLGDQEIALALIGLAAVMGHTWSLYLGFRGGKGVATSGGVLLALAPVALVLAQAGSEVTLIGRPSHVEAVARDGVRMVVAGKVSNQSVLAARPSIAEAGGPFDYVFLTVKGYDTLDAIDQLQLALRPGTILGSFQNGVGNEETIALALPEQALVAGSLTVPVSLDEPGTIQLHSRRGGVALAPVSPEVNVAPLVRKLGDTGLKARRYADFRAMKWSKLLFNIIGNAQSAILDLPPSHVFADSELFRYERAAFLEAVTVMNRMRLSVVALPGLPAPSLRRAMNLPPLLAQMLLEPRLGGARGNKMPSLWWDLSRAKGKTEAAFLNGAVVDAGRRYDVPTPVNSVLWAIVEKSTKLPSEWERYRRQPDRLKALLRTAIRL